VTERRGTVTSSTKGVFEIERVVLIVKGELIEKRETHGLPKKDVRSETILNPNALDFLLDKRILPPRQFELILSETQGLFKRRVGLSIITGFLVLPRKQIGIPILDQEPQDNAMRL
jgi:hypothetical protein